MGLPDFGGFVGAFNSNDELKCHFEATDPAGPIAGNCVVGLDDFGYFVSVFNSAPGPSGTTPGTVACP